MYDPIVTMLDNVESSFPLFDLRKLNLDSMGQATIHHLCLIIVLGMGDSGIFKVTMQKRPKHFLEGTKKTCTPIVYNTRREAKVSPHMGKEEINSMSNNSGFGARDKKGHSIEMKNNNLDNIFFQKGHRNTTK